MLFIISMLAFLTVPVWSLSLLQVAAGRDVRPLRSLSYGLGMALIYGASWHFREPEATAALLEASALPANVLNLVGGFWLGALGVALIIVDRAQLRRYVGVLAALTLLGIAPVHVAAHQAEIPVFGHEWRGPFLELRLTLQALLIISALLIAFVREKPTNEQPAA